MVLKKRLSGSKKWTLWVEQRREQGTIRTNFASPRLPRCHQWSRPGEDGHAAEMQEEE